MRRGIVVLALAALCARPAVGARADGRIVKVGPSANGKSVLLRPGDELVVSLPGNATTGYTWLVRSVDRTVLKHTKTTYVPKKTTPPKTGAGGTYVLRFRAVAGGSTTLRLAYVQAGGSKPAQRFTLKIEVKGPPHV